jgi:hypothetical protein
VYSHGVSGTALPVPTPTQLQPLAAKLGPFGVLEWTQIARGRLDTRLTCINEEGTSIYSLGPPPIDDIRSLSLRLRTRLNGWFRGRADPLDVPEWRTLHDWLRNELDDRPSIDHLVVIEHVVVPGLPWHAMRDTQWTVSYASSWTELFDIAQAIDATSPPASLGIVRVPRTFESPLIVDSLQEAARRLGDLARTSGMTLAEAANGEADAPRVSALMGSCDVLQLLCHGFVSTSEEEVALMLASEGQLPLGNSAAADTVIGRRHRFGWRELEHVERAPAYVWSAACSTGSTHLVGLSERLGLFRSLRAKGTLSLIAPRWYAKAEYVLPTMSTALQLWLTQGVGVAHAVRQASDDASEYPWLAAALAIEGAWV